VTDRLGHAFVVRTKVMKELLSDADWRRRWVEAKTFRLQMRVVMDFCLERGYGIHHDVVTGRLVVCH